jgi:hypothetical protein
MQFFNQSPKYPLRWHDIRYVLGRGRLRSKWKDKVRHQVKKSFFPDIIDFIDVHVNIDAITRQIRKEIATGAYAPALAARYRVEKSRGLCRLMVNPHPYDLLILQTLSDTLYHQIKKTAPSKNAFFEPQDHSFSKLSGSEPSYDTFSSWKKFHQKILGFQRDSEYIIVTDVANYYDFIDFGSLRNVLSARKQINESLMYFLIFILRSLSWQPDFMPFRSTGLPQINADAPRLLAHAYLFELDAFIERTNKKQYARFMDDIDAGVDSIAEAKKLLRDIDLVLQSRNLRLNSGKTKIMSAAEALIHFRVRENSLLDKLEAIIKAKVAGGGSGFVPIVRLLNIAERMLDKQAFDSGNGEKIYKRVLGLATSHKVPVSDKIFRDIIFRRPNLRESSFRNAAICGFGASQFDAVTEYFDHGLACDDAFQMNLAKSIVGGLLIYDGHEKSRIKALLDKMETDSASGIHSVLWLLSRFAKPDTFLKAAKDLTRGRSLHSFTYRLIGGYAGRIIRDPALMHQLRTLVATFKDRGAETVFEYVYDLSVDASMYKSILAILKAKNASSPLGCTHAKYFLLNSVLNNSSLPTKDRHTLTATHSAILSEHSYVSVGLI